MADRVFVPCNIIRAANSPIPGATWSAPRSTTTLTATMGSSRRSLNSTRTPFESLAASILGGTNVTGAPGGGAVLRKLSGPPLAGGVAIDAVVTARALVDAPAPGVGGGGFLHAIHESGAARAVAAARSVRPDLMELMVSGCFQR